MCLKHTPMKIMSFGEKEGYADAWVMGPIMKNLGELKDSMVKCPNNKPGKKFEGYEKWAT